MDNGTHEEVAGNGVSATQNAAFPLVPSGFCERDYTPRRSRASASRPW